MTEFIQLHMLVSYPPSNLNRDDLGRPKTAVMGGQQRLRISSQSLKRAWRESEVFSTELAGHQGIRTKEMGKLIAESFKTGTPLRALIAGKKDQPAAFTPVKEIEAVKYAHAIAGVFGKLKKGDDSLEIEQLAHFSPEEILEIENFIITVAGQGKTPVEDEMNLLRKRHTAADIAMFGRMLASSPAYNTEAAVQVAHAITVHSVAVEDDYFTAVDDLNRGDEDLGAGHIGETEFAAGLFYLYLCINTDLLRENLMNDRELTRQTLRSLIKAAATVSPTGKQNSFGSRAYASYLLAEKGSQQPRSLSVAFLSPEREHKDLLGSAIEALHVTKSRMDQAYGACSEGSTEMNLHTGEGSLADILNFVAGTHA